MRKALLGLAALVAMCGLGALAVGQAAPAGATADTRPAMGMHWGHHHLDLNLTAEQKAKIAEIRKSAHEQIMGVLTDEQKAKITAAKAKFEEMRPNLSDDQKAQIKAIFEAAREKAKSAKTVDEKVAIFKDAHAQAMKVLTPEQLKKVEAFKGHFGGWGHGGRMMHHRMPATAPAM
jgi:Spy/CpxP family protein refolding chaperone